MKIQSLSFKNNCVNKTHFYRNVHPNSKLLFKGIPVSRIKSARVLGDHPRTLSQSINGTFLVDDDTGTKIHYGAEASDFLEKQTRFDSNTEIIAQSKTKIKVTCDEGSYILDEPGGILVEKGTRCNIRVLEGAPLVVQYERKPGWYEDLKPSNEHQEFFATLARKNHEIWVGHAKEPISEHQNPGEVEERDFYRCPSWVFPKLVDRNLIVQNNGKTNWGGYWDNNNFQRDLYEQVGIFGDVKDDVLRVWQDTTKSGYDISGLKEVFNGITIYTHKDKFNQHNLNPTEWITNSTAWTKSGPFMVGVSRVINLDSKAARDFNEIRLEEKLHAHQDTKTGNSLTEIYLVTQGSAIMYILKDGKPEYNLVKEGEMVILPKYVKHGIISISGEYEHLCTQAPSVFQYGFEFKNTIRDFLNSEKVDALRTMQANDAVSRYNQQA